MADNFHESYRETRELKTSSDRSFGLSVGGILLLIALIRWWHHDWQGGWATVLLAAVGVLLVLAGLVRAELLAPLNRLWTRLGLLMFRVVNPVVMFLIFIVAIVPIGLFLRLRGHDAMRLKPDPEARSYWIAREPPGPPPATMINQF